MPLPKLSEKDVEERFNKIVNFLKKRIGHDTLKTNECNYWGNLLFSDKYKGTFPADIPADKNGYSIINLDSSDMGGSHWVAKADGYIWDSYARDIVKKLPLQGKGQTLHNADMLDSNQTKYEVDCGIRCLAWLYIVESCGIENAKKI
jgi:hypothetical protein